MDVTKSIIVTGGEIIEDGAMEMRQLEEHKYDLWQEISLNNSFFAQVKVTCMHATIFSLSGRFQ